MSVLREMFSQYDPDVVCVQETKHSIRTRASVPGYRLYKGHREGHAQGLFTYVKASLQATRIPTKTDTCESLALEIPTPHGPITVVNFYRSPSFGDAKELRSLDEFEDILIIGDLNAKNPLWGEHRTDVSGRVVEQLADELGLAIVAPDAPTRVDKHGNKSTIDFALSRGVVTVDTLHTGSCNKSDHLPIIASIPLRPLAVPPRKGWNYRKADWAKYRKILDANISVGNIGRSSEDLEKAVKSFTEAIQKAAKGAIPRFPIKGGLAEPTEKLNNLRKERNRARKQWQKTGRQDDLRRYQQSLREVQAEWESIGNANWAEIINKPDDYRRTMWRICRAMKRGAREEIPPLEKGGKVAISDQDKAEMLADAATVTLQPTDMELCRLVDELNQEINRSSELTPPSALVKPKQLRKIIQTFKLGKAPGTDGINAHFIKNLSRKGIACLCSLINALITNQYFPSLWKDSEVISLAKEDKKPSDPASYRPISLLPILSKVYEKVIKVHLEKWLDDNNIIPSFQHGFRKARGTITQLARMEGKIKLSRARNNSTIIVSFDLSKAFDTMWQEGLVYKLRTKGCPGYLVKIISSYLQQRTYHVKTNEATSSVRTLRCGVPQGSVLGPILFNIYLSDMPEPDNCTLAGYADDTTLICRSANPTKAAEYASRASDTLLRYFNRWQLTVNRDKTKVIPILHKKPKKKLEVTIDNKPNKKGTPLAIVNTHKLLGLTFSNRHNYIAEIRARKSSANRAYYKLFSMSGPKALLSTENKIRLYKAVYRPILTYGCEVWSPYAAKSRWKSLQTFQDKVLKAALGKSVRSSTTEMRQKIPIQGIKEYCENMRIKFIERFKGSQDTHIKTLLAQFNT